MVREQKRLYQRWPGRNRFLFNGRVMIGPDRSLPVVALSALAAVAPYLLYIFNGCHSSHTSEDLSLTSIVVLTTMLGLWFASLFAAMMSDPGVLPRAGVVKSTEPRIVDAASPPPQEVDWLVDGDKNADMERDEGESDDSDGDGDESSDSDGDDDENENDDIADSNNNVVRMVYCEKCDIYRQWHSKHCRTCDNCINGWDHHCPWIGNCVGLGNYGSYLTFITVTIFHAGFLFLFIFKQVLLLSSNVSGWGSGPNATPARRVLHFMMALAHCPALLLALAIVIPGTTLLVPLLYAHVDNVFQGWLRDGPWPGPNPGNWDTFRKDPLNYFTNLARRVWDPPPSILPDMTLEIGHCGDGGGILMGVTGSVGAMRTESGADRAHDGAWREAPMRVTREDMLNIIATRPDIACIVPRHEGRHPGHSQGAFAKCFKALGWQ